MPKQKFYYAVVNKETQKLCFRGATPAIYNSLYWAKHYWPSILFEHLPIDSDEFKQFIQELLKRQNEKEDH